MRGNSASAAVTAAQFGGLAHTLALGLLFLLGMTLADGANGLWIASLLRRADACARIASRDTVTTSLPITVSTFTPSLVMRR